MKKVNLSDYFNIKSAIQDDKINFEIADKNDTDSIPFLGRSSTNNGIVDYVKFREGFVNEGGQITIALDGSTGSTFYQHHPFSSGQNIWILEPTKEVIDYINPKVAIYLITTIRKAVVDYSYNLGLTKTRLENNISIILPVLPNGKLNLKEIESKISNLRNIELISKINANRI